MTLRYVTLRFITRRSWKYVLLTSDIAGFMLKVLRGRLQAMLLRRRTWGESNGWLPLEKSCRPMSIRWQDRHGGSGHPSESVSKVNRNVLRNWKVYLFQYYMWLRNPTNGNFHKCYKKQFEAICSRTNIAQEKHCVRSRMPSSGDLGMATKTVGSWTRANMSQRQVTNKLQPYATKTFRQGTHQSLHLGWAPWRGSEGQFCTSSQLSGSG